MDRATPYQVAFAEEVFEREHFPAIREEAEATGARSSDPQTFLNLRSVAPLLRETLTDLHHTAVEEFGPLLFQGYHFWRFDKHVFGLEDALLRQLLAEPTAVGEWRLSAPEPAGYLQLPRNLLWARIAEDSPPESIDGVFWTLVGDGDPMVPPFPRLDLLVVLGMMSGRPGFSIAEIALELGPEPQGQWAAAHAREQDPDFANILPGGELQQLLGVETTGEVLKLVSRCFWHLTQHPETWDG